jgi:hypothetical protein
MVEAMAINDSGYNAQSNGGLYLAIEIALVVV